MTILRRLFFSMGLLPLFLSACGAPAMPRWQTAYQSITSKGNRYQVTIRPSKTLLTLINGKQKPVLL